MKLERLELRRIALDLVTPFRTSFGVEVHRDILLLHVTTDRGDGWGECVASHERALRQHGVPREAVQSAVRIASVIHAVAGVLDYEDARAA